MVTNSLTGVAQSHYLCVSRRIEISDIPIPASANDLAIKEDDRSDGYLACVQGALGAAERLLHPEFVQVGVLLIQCHFQTL